MQGILAIADHAIEPNRLLVFGTVLRQYVLLAGRIIGDERNRPSERIRWIESEHKTFVVEASIVLILDEIAIQMVTFTNASGLRHRLIHTRQSVSQFLSKPAIRWNRFENHSEAVPASPIISQISHSRISGL